MKTIWSLLFLILAYSFQGQTKETLKEFDELYRKATNLLVHHRDSSVRLLKILQEQDQKLSDIQRAKVNYLILRLYFPSTGRHAELEKTLLSIPDSLKGIDSVRFLAHLYLERSMPDRAIPLLLDALKTGLYDQNTHAHFQIELSEAYRQKQEYQKGLQLLYSLLDPSVTLSDFNRAFAWNRLAALYNESEKPPASYIDSVFRYSRLCINLAERTNNKSDLAASLNELSYQFRRKHEYTQALNLSKRAVVNFIDSRMPFHAMNALINQSSIFASMQEYPEALGSLRQATRLAPIWQNRNLYMRIYRQFAGVYAAIGQYDDAYEFLLLCNQLQLEFFKDRINSQIHEQTARYDLLVKDQKIREEQKKNEFNQQQIILLILIIATLTIVFIFSLFYFRIRRKEAMRKKLVEAVVETETNERRRIARDLHDGLGPVLSAINHYFQAYLDASPNNQVTIRTRLQTVISEAIDEVSRISHNISPHVLEKHGLMTALNTLFSPLLTSGKFQINFSCNVTGRLDSNVELTVYRCITELVNNTLKHADASTISLDIRHSAEELLIRYSDNGKGFPADSRKPAGMGLTNITNRVESFGGSFSYENSPDSGIRVYITIPLKL